MNLSPCFLVSDPALKVSHCLKGGLGILERFRVARQVVPIAVTLGKRDEGAGKRQIGPQEIDKALTGLAL
jgi:hypothetical protein